MIVHISHTSKVMLKMIQARLQQMWTENIQSKLGLEKAKDQRPNRQHLLNHRESKGTPEKASTSASLTTLKCLIV